MEFWINVKNLVSDPLDGHQWEVECFSKSQMMKEYWKYKEGPNNQKVEELPPIPIEDLPIPKILEEEMVIPEEIIEINDFEDHPLHK